MTPRLILVRHAEPCVVESEPANHWRLSAAGARAAAGLAAYLPPDAYLVSSDEPKARQTLEPAGPVVTDPRLREVHRTEPFDGDFRARRRGYVSGVDHPGWENRESVARRIDQCIAAHRAAAANRPLVVAGHGMALTLWLTAKSRLGDPGEFWAELRLPDAFDFTGGQLRRLG